MDPAASIFKMIYRDQPVGTEGLPWRKEDFTKRKRPPTEAASRDPAHRQRAHCTMDRSGWMARECRATDRNLNPDVAESFPSGRPLRRPDFIRLQSGFAWPEIRSRFRSRRGRCKNTGCDTCRTNPGVPPWFRRSASSPPIWWS